jgi:hypothetical protein
MKKDKMIEVRTSTKAKEKFIETCKSHDKTQSYLVNLLIDAFIAEPIDTVVKLEKLKASNLWK